MKIVILKSYFQFTDDEGNYSFNLDKGHPGKLIGENKNNYIVDFGRAYVVEVPKKDSLLYDLSRTEPEKSLRLCQCESCKNTWTLYD